MYRAIHKETGVQVAIKILELVGENDSDNREEAIVNEIKIMSEAAKVRY